MKKRLLFITGTLESGRSGVADYTLKLASELANLDVSCTCIAINDIFYVGPSAYSSIRTKVGNVRLIRFSSSLPWKKRIDQLKIEIKNFNPDWISLQYVAYAYHVKGIPFNLAYHLKAFMSLAHWHIMVHELWLDPSTSIKNRVISTAQKFVTLFLFRQLRPSVIHTSNKWYQSLLLKSGFKCYILPLFSSIPFKPVNHTASSSSSSSSSSSFRCMNWTFILFGSISRDWHAEPLLANIEEARICASIKSCTFVSIGSNSAQGVRLWDSLQTSVYPAFNFKCLGELSAERVSEELQFADFGISVSPSHLIEKSSSAAAMTAHGLPVIISRVEPTSDLWNQSLKKGGKYILLDSSFVHTLIHTKKFKPHCTLEDTANHFLQSLQSIQ